jgi:hypothetical protein
MNHLISRNFAMVALVFVAASSAAAQAAPPAGGGVGRGGRLGQPPAARVALERQVRQALAKVTRRQLGLNDAQMIKLRQVDMRFEQQRRALVQEQRDNRLALRAIMQDTAGVDQAKVSEHMDKLLQLERRRIDVLEAEQKELLAAHQACKAAAESDGPDAYYYANERFHFAIYDAAHNSFLAAQARQLHRKLRVCRARLASDSGDRSGFRGIRPMGVPDDDGRRATHHSSTVAAVCRRHRRCGGAVGPRQCAH